MPHVSQAMFKTSGHGSALGGEQGKRRGSEADASDGGFNSGAKVLAAREVRPDVKPD